MFIKKINKNMFVYEYPGVIPFVSTNEHTHTHFHTRMICHTNRLVLLVRAHTTTGTVSRGQSNRKIYTFCLRFGAWIGRGKVGWLGSAECMCVYVCVSSNHWRTFFRRIGIRPLTIFGRCCYCRCVYACGMYVISRGSGGGRKKCKCMRTISIN